MYLHLPANAKVGFGSVLGTLVVKLKECYAEFKLSDEILNASITNDGILNLSLQSNSRQRIEIKGDPPQEDGFNDKLYGISEFKMTLEPDSEFINLKGKYTNERGNQLVDLATNIAIKIA